MAADINTCTFTGNLTRDAELAYTQSGKALSRFSLAVNGYRDGQVSFFDFTCWGKLAEVITEYLKKGTAVAVSSSATLDQWTSKDGDKRSAVKFHVQSIKLTGGRGGAAHSVASAAGSAPVGNEDIPF